MASRPAHPPAGRARKLDQDMGKLGLRACGFADQRHPLHHSENKQRLAKAR
ncbi:hypothetical protein [Ottowia oryzae]